MYPTLEEVKKLAEQGEYRRIPVCRELYADRYTPVEVMRTLRAASRHCFLLESAEQNQQWGRYSILGYDPVLELTCKGGTLTIRSGDMEEFTREETEKTSHPGEAIRRILDRYKSPRLPGMPPFTGGMVGYFSYEYLRYPEPVLNFPEPGETDFRDVDLMLFTRALVFDHYRQKLCLVAGVDTEQVETSYRQAEEEMAQMEELLKSGARAVFPRIQLLEELKPVFSREQYKSMVEKARTYIREGDIFQVVLSNPQTAAAKGSLFDTYRVLRTTNPSPYMFYFSSDDIEIAGASPETLVNLENRTVRTFPLAGTRPRGKTPREDQRLERELLADEKELAEHNMLVDLGRNDLGKICSLGSVQVERYCQIERFSCVMHIGSQVSGRLMEGKDGVDAVDAVLPAGTLSGAPKIRACQIIQELEQRPRGVYGGAVGYLDFAGNMDTCIGIRLVYKKNGRVCVQSGAGIVADSVPDKEYQECVNKARAVVEAIRTAEEGLE
ncbi:MAG TPA: anthranilate synthase component I [Candidatus Pullilachnospira intestinigallinarum]|nr:anthranilate synthase component I [Candidatus Pullilachnospira intestinigallinarum]